MSSKVEVLWHYDKKIFDKIGLVVESAIQKAMAKTLELAKTEAKHLCRVDTGRLRSSITSNYTGSGQTVIQPFTKGADSEGKTETIIKEPKEQGAIVGLLGTNINYAPYQEYGTKTMTGKPYLHPALILAGNLLPEKIRQELAKIKKVE